MEGRGGIDAMGVKDAGLDAMSALELIVAVAKTEQVRNTWMHAQSLSYRRMLITSWMHAQSFMYRK
jgi:hypothetical protein